VIARLRAWSLFRWAALRVLAAALRVAFGDFFHPRRGAARRDRLARAELVRSERESRQTVALLHAKVALAKIREAATGGSGERLKAVRKTADVALAQLSDVPLPPTLKRRMRERIADEKNARGNERLNSRGGLRAAHRDFNEADRQKAAALAAEDQQRAEAAAAGVVEE